MIRLKFNPVQNVPAFEKTIITKATPLLSQRLGIADYNRTLEIDWGKINFSRANTQGMSCDGLLGPDEHEATTFFMGGPPVRSFKMWLTPQTNVQIVRVFCHEFVHLKQWVTGEISIKPGTLALIWHDVEFSPHQIETMPELSKPWEQEAYRKQDDLASYVLKELVRRESQRSTNDNTKQPAAA